MTLLYAWYSIRHADRSVYHDNDLCAVGQAIPAKYRKRGHRCRMRCSTCAKLGAPDELARRFALMGSF
jgi:hypothetical protein